MQQEAFKNEKKTTAILDFFDIMGHSISIIFLCSRTNNCLVISGISYCAILADCFNNRAGFDIYYCSHSVSYKSNPQKNMISESVC